MRTLYKLLLTIMCLIVNANTCVSQEINYLSEIEFDNIRVDGVAWKEIQKTNGDVKAMKSLFGNTIKFKTADDPSPRIGFWDRGFYFEFEDRSGRGNFELVHFSIKNNKSNISIKDSSATIGSDVEELDYSNSRMYGRYGSSITYMRNGSESDPLFISFWTASKKIYEIKFISFN